MGSPLANMHNNAFTKVEGRMPVTLVAGLMPSTSHIFAIF